MATVMDAPLRHEAGPTSPGPSAELRGQTWAARQRLERRLDIRSCFADRPRYRQLLELLWGIYSVFEHGLGPHLLEEALPDVAARRKAPLLERDLRLLSRAADPLADLRCCASLPGCEDPASAFGCLYVLESPSLGGRALLPLAEGRLGLDAEFGAAFLANYGSRASCMSGRFDAALDAWLVTPERLGRAVQSAVDTCTGVGDWLCAVRE